ncbi:MAG: hypothetical protein QHG99_08990 [Methanomicrobiales archaeon]|nr:hypothetical protein [Methanomicrobiales archaeon]
MIKKSRDDSPRRSGNCLKNPDIHGKPLRGSLHGLWELYFERKFRILYTIDFEKGEVIIEAIKHKDEF